MCGSSCHCYAEQVALYSDALVYIILTFTVNSSFFFLKLCFLELDEFSSAKHDISFLVMILRTDNVNY